MGICTLFDRAMVKVMVLVILIRFSRQSMSYAQSFSVLDKALVTVNIIMWAFNLAGVLVRGGGGSGEMCLCLC